MPFSSTCPCHASPAAAGIFKLVDDYDDDEIGEGPSMTLWRRSRFGQVAEQSPIEVSPSRPATARQVFTSEIIPLKFIEYRNYVYLYLACELVSRGSSSYFAAQVQAVKMRSIGRF